MTDQKADSRVPHQITFSRTMASETSTDDDAVPERPAKRVKRSIEDDLICPITLELPFDPVTAMDGQVYEREAIAKHIANHCVDLRSPITNKGMGTLLLPAPRHKNIIEVSIENRAITGELAKSWISKRTYKKKVDAMTERATGGDTVAMAWLCKAFFFGKSNGCFMRNHGKALRWAKQAHRCGIPIGTSIMGTLMVPEEESRSEG